MSAISVESLGKAYRIGLKEEIPDTLMGAATSWLKAPLRNFHRLRKLNTFRSNGDADEDIIWALRDVSFEVPEGEVLGIIGRNGAGKSTLLKILSRITEPTAGRAVIRGRVSSLLEVGTGFHPELSGRENIYMNGTILGMRKKEIDRKLDEIIDFSGVEKFLDTPIKRYSSGMKVRLAFAVAAHLEPEILIIDEVLAVGDAEFQKKCLGKMEEVAKGGRTVLFVSHQLGAVESLCDRVIVLRNGFKDIEGLPRECIESYLSNSGSEGRNKGQRLSVPEDLALARISEAILINENGDTVQSIGCGSGFGIEVKINVFKALNNPRCIVFVSTIGGQRLFRLDSAELGFSSNSTSRDFVFIVTAPYCPLAPGMYEVSVRLRDGASEMIDEFDQALTFSVEPSVQDDRNSIRAGKREVLVLPQKWERMEAESSGRLCSQTF